VGKFWAVSFYVVMLAIWLAVLWFVFLTSPEQFRLL
jgi:hypothetical protein